MGAIAVELNDEAVARPEEIGNEGAGLNVHLGPGKAVATTEAEEASLELASCLVGSEPLVEGKPQVLRLT